MTLPVGHLVATWFMVGVVWMVQVVHYPLFGSVGSAGFTSYENRHTRRMGALIAVPASAEVVLALLLVLVRPDGIDIWAAWVAGTILAAIWVITLLVQVPIHRRLSERFDEGLVEALVRTNWVRTAAWTVRGIIAAMLLI
jgi:hypothetical protein